MRKRLFTIVLFCAFHASSFSHEQSIATGAPNTGGSQPNIIWIVLDACRASNLTPYGYERPTSPHIQKIADSGIVFENHFAQASKTMWSVPSYMTGQYFPTPCFSKSFSYTVFERTPPEGEELISTTLGANGWTTAMFSNMPLFFETDRLSQSFDDVFLWGVGEDILLQRWADTMVTPLSQWLGDNKSTPFFLYIHAADTHFPHKMVSPYDQWIDPDYDRRNVISTEWGQDYEPKHGTMFTEEDKEFFRGYYDGMILDADAQIGLLLEALDYHGLSDNTILIINSDHGQLLGENGRTVDHVGETDEVLRIPLIFSGPRVSAGRRVSALSENVDIVPTLIDLLSIDSTAIYHGRSLTPLFNDAVPDEWRNHVFAIPDRMPYEQPLTFAVITEKFKYWQNFDATHQKLWAMPDSARNRITVEFEEVNEVVMLKHALQNTILPLFKSFNNLPVEAVAFESLWLAFNAEQRDAVGFHLSFDDANIENEALGQESSWLYKGGFLSARNGLKPASTLTYTAAIPNGEYNLYIAMQNSTDISGAPASSVRLHIQDEENARVATQSSLPPDQGTISLTNMGQVGISDGKFQFSIQPNRDYWAVLHSIHLAPATHEPTQENLPQLIIQMPKRGDGLEIHEKMKALGYL